MQAERVGVQAAGMRAVDKPAAGMQAEQAGVQPAEIPAERPVFRVPGLQAEPD